MLKPSKTVKVDFVHLRNKCTMRLQWQLLGNYNSIASCPASIWVSKRQSGKDFGEEFIGAKPSRSQLVAYHYVTSLTSLTSRTCWCSKKAVGTQWLEFQNRILESRFEQPFCHGCLLGGLGPVIYSQINLPHRLLWIENGSVAIEQHFLGCHYEKRVDINEVSNKSDNIEGAD